MRDSGSLIGSLISEEHQTALFAAAAIAGVAATAADVSAHQLFLVAPDAEKRAAYGYSGKF